MLTKNIDLKNFKKKKKNKNIEKIFSKIKKDFNSKSDLFLTSLSSKYQNTFNIDIKDDNAFTLNHAYN